MGGNGKKSELPARTTANRRSRRLDRSRTTMTRMATSPRRSATAMATTTSRCRASNFASEGAATSVAPLPIGRGGIEQAGAASANQTLAKLLALNPPDTRDIEQMRAPAAARESDATAGCGEQHHRNHRQRHRADPVETQRLPIANIGSFPRPALCPANLMTDFRVPALFAGAAMQRYSWTNNRQPVFWPRLAGPYFKRGFWIRYGRRSRRTATSQDEGRPTVRCARWRRFRSPIGSAISICSCCRCCFRS